MKFTQVRLLIIVLLIILIYFIALWLFHDGADQSQVIIENSVQDKYK